LAISLDYTASSGPQKKTPYARLPEIHKPLDNFWHYKFAIYLTFLGNHLYLSDNHIEFIIGMLVADKLFK